MVWVWCSEPGRSRLPDTNSGDGVPSRRRSSPAAPDLVAGLGCVRTRRRRGCATRRHASARLLEDENRVRLERAIAKETSARTASAE